jgi:tetratricopeptide (TPR) repeat protein
LSAPSRTLAALLSTLLLFAPLTAVAQDYDEQTIAEVNAHFEAGAQYFYEENWEAAIEEFEAGHRKIPNAIFLYNISLAYTRMGNREKALEYAVAADEMGGLGQADHTQNQARIVALMNANHAESVAESRTIGEPLFNFSLLGWIGTGAIVGGLLAYGGVVGIDRGLAADVEAYRAAAEANDVANYERLRDEIRPKQTGGRLLFVVGTLAIVGGVSLIVYDTMIRGDNDTKAGVAIVPTRDGAVLSVSGRF